MCCVRAQERGDVGSARQLVESTLLNRFEVRTTNAQALGNILDRESACFTLISQQPANSMARRCLTLHAPPIDLVRHEPLYCPLVVVLPEGIWQGKSDSSFDAKFRPRDRQRRAAESRVEGDLAASAPTRENLWPRSNRANEPSPSPVRSRPATSKESAHQLRAVQALRPAVPPSRRILLDRRQRAALSRPQNVEVEAVPETSCRSGQPLGCCRDQRHRGTAADHSCRPK